MSQVVCVVETDEKKVLFTWYEGTGAFTPYRLTDSRLHQFRAAARRCREQLDVMASDYLAWVNAGSDADRQAKDAALGQTCHLLACEGHKIYDRLFRPDDDEAKAKKVRKWLEHLRDRGEVESLELVLDGDAGVPWNVVYDQPPAEKGFLSGDGTEAWRPFWGVRYNLAAGKRVDPLRRVPAPAAPCLRMVVDQSTLDSLPKEQRQRLLAFARDHGCEPLIQKREELDKALSGGRPDLLYWLSHATPEALELDGERVEPLSLFELLETSMSDEPDRFPGLVFLNACRTAESPGTGPSFLGALHDARCGGVIATEQQTVNTFANPLGLDFLEAFLDRGEPIGTAMQVLRGRVPMGLVYASYCPPHLRKVPATPIVTSPTIAMPQPKAGSELGRPATPVRPPLPLPKLPYRSLSYYDRDDRALFAGRDGDVLRFARILDESTTRVLVLHGESGCGKSSFLRAGVMPFLEEECVGYRFMRDRSEGGGPSPLFIRATKDLPGQIADALVRFCGQPLSHVAPQGQPVVIDLPGILGGRRDLAVLRQALLDDPALLGRVLSGMAERLPFTPVMVIDQAEEVFTLAREKEDAVTRAAALEMLRQASEATGRFKVVIALRTEYYGRFVDGLRRGVRPAYGVREYLLTDFNEAQLTEAILRPTGFEQYGFRYADGVAQRLASDIVDYCRNRQDSVLPLAQVVCTQLHEVVEKRPPGSRIIGAADVEAVGGLKGGMKRHVDELLGRYLPGPADQKAFRKLLAHLYHTQPDGALTTALMPVNRVAGQRGSVEEHWQGKMPLPELLEVMTDSDVRLLRQNTLHLGGGERRAFVSLGHDALAPVADEWRSQFEQAERRRKWLLRFGAACLGALLMAMLAIVARYEASQAWQAETRAKEAAHEARLQAYLAQMNLAQRAWEDTDIARLVELLQNQRPERTGGDDLRGFEWYYWWRLTHSALLTIDSRSGSVSSVAFSPDGKRIASGDEDRTVRVWDAENGGEALLILPGHKGEVSSVAFSPDGKRITSGDEDRTVRVWDAEKGGEALLTLKRHNGGVLSVAFSPDAKRIACGCEDGPVRVWDAVNGGEALLTLPGHNGWVWSVAFSPDGKRIASGDGDGPVRVWDAVNGGEALLTLKGQNGGVWSVAFSPDGKRIASGGRDGTVRVWDAQVGQETLTLKGVAASENSVTSVTFSPNGERIASGRIDGTVRVWDAPKVP